MTLLSRAAYAEVLRPGVRALAPDRDAFNCFPGLEASSLLEARVHSLEHC